MNYPTLEELQAQGLDVKGIYVGPFSLEKAQEYAEYFSSKVNEVTGKKFFPDVRVVSQSDLYNVVYVEQTEEPKPKPQIVDGRFVDLTEMINHCCDRKRQEEGRTVYEYYGGDIGSWYTVDKRLPKEFHHIEGWDDSSYRGVWASDVHLTIATYCEGDLSFSVSESVEAYQADIVSAHKFYCLEQTDVDAFTCIPDELPIAKAAIEAMEDYDRQLWRYNHLFLSGHEDSFADALFSDIDELVVWRKTIEFCVAIKEENEVFLREFLSNRFDELKDELIGEDAYYRKPWFRMSRTGGASCFALGALMNAVPSELKSDPQLVAYTKKYFSDAYQLA